MLSETAAVFLITCWITQRNLDIAQSYLLTDTHDIGTSDHISGRYSEVMIQLSGSLCFLYIYSLSLSDKQGNKSKM